MYLFENYFPIKLIISSDESKPYNLVRILSEFRSNVVLLIDSNQLLNCGEFEENSIEFLTFDTFNNICFISIKDLQILSNHYTFVYFSLSLTYSLTFLHTSIPSARISRFNTSMNAVNVDNTSMDSRMLSMSGIH